MRAHPKFISGQYKATVDLLLDAKSRKSHISSLIGALSFLGRMEEAQDLFDLEASKSKQAIDQVASRFFLAIGYTRRSEYKRAERLFRENERKAGRSKLEKFFVAQGKAFFSFYTGRVGAALEAAQEALKWALASGDLFARRLATDALGVAQVSSGDIHKGLGYLKEAERLAQRLGNAPAASAVQITRKLFQWEYGLASESLASLEELGNSHLENTYTRSSLYLELARQFTLRGSFSKAAAYLEKAAGLIYASQDRRKEILLNLRLAELSGRQGEFFQARHYLRFARRLLHLEVDSSFELAALGIERKLALAEGLELGLIDKRWQELREFSSTRDRNLRARIFGAVEGQNPEDKVHGILALAESGKTLEEKISPLLQSGFLAEVALKLKLKPGEKAVAVLPGGFGLLVQEKSGIHWQQEKLTSLQTKILRLLSSGQEVSKEHFVEKVWGYKYAPLRHDSMVYASLSALRKALGPASSWCHPTENGYVMDARVIWASASEKTVMRELPLPALAPGLNHRQIEILEWARSERFLSVPECGKKFRVSEITALRDLDGLRRLGLMVRVGKARATRYGLSQGETQ